MSKLQSVESVGKEFLKYFGHIVANSATINGVKFNSMTELIDKLVAQRDQAIKEALLDGVEKAKVKVQKEGTFKYDWCYDDIKDIINQTLK